MKKVKNSSLWYNACDKEIGGILLAARESTRRNAPYTDARLGLRFLGLDLRSKSTIL